MQTWRWIIIVQNRKVTSSVQKVIGWNHCFVLHINFQQTLIHFQREIQSLDPRFISPSPLQGIICQPGFCYSILQSLTQMIYSLTESALQEQRPTQRNMQWFETCSDLHVEWLYRNSNHAAVKIIKAFALNTARVNLNNICLRNIVCWLLLSQVNQISKRRDN